MGKEGMMGRGEFSRERRTLPVTNALPSPATEQSPNSPRRKKSEKGCKRSGGQLVRRGMQSYNPFYSMSTS